MGNSVFIWSTQGAVRPHKSMISQSVHFGPVLFLSALARAPPFCSIPYCAAPSCLPVCRTWRTKQGVLARKKQHWAFYRYIIQDKPGYWLTTYLWVWGLLDEICLLACVHSIYSTVDMNAHKHKFLSTHGLKHAVVMLTWQLNNPLPVFYKSFLWHSVINRESLIEPPEQRLTISSLLLLLLYYC